MDVLGLPEWRPVVVSEPSCLPGTLNRKYEPGYSKLFAMCLIFSLTDGAD